MSKELHPFSAAVYLKQVSYQIGKRRILDQISLTMKQGTITGLLGPNGAGKTTLLSLILGLRHPSAGTITVFHEQLSRRSGDLRRRMGVVFQETALYDELTTFENLQFAASLYQISHPQRRIKEVLELLTLFDRAQDRVGTLSGGLKRRVAIARALLHAPDLLVIDEPTLGVDVETRHAIWSHLRFLKSTGTSIMRYGGCTARWEVADLRDSSDISGAGWELPGYYMRGGGERSPGTGSLWDGWHLTR
jgi:ABC-2 type transport system ATP-binding protein